MGSRHTEGKILIWQLYINDTGSLCHTYQYYWELKAEGSAVTETEMMADGFKLQLKHQMGSNEIRFLNWSLFCTDNSLHPDTANLGSI